MISVLAIGRYNYYRSLDLALASRALGASSIAFSFLDKKPPNHKEVTEKVREVTKRWGGTFKVNFVDDWKDFLSTKKNYKKIYLTMYGVPARKMTYALRTYKNILLIVTTDGPMKDLFTSVDFNVSITGQPHSSISAVAIFLYEFYKEREPAMKFENAKFKVVPDQAGINVEKA